MKYVTIFVLFMKSNLMLYYKCHNSAYITAVMELITMPIDVV